MRCTLVKASQIFIVWCKLYNFIIEERVRREGPTATTTPENLSARTPTIMSSVRRLFFLKTTYTANRKSRASYDRDMEPFERVLQNFSSL
jgi:site-specific recombinase XerD